MSKENMPKVLPQTLPVGTKFANDHCFGELTGTAKLAHDRFYEGTARWTIRSTCEERASTDCVLNPGDFVWPAEGAAWVPKVGERVRVKDSCSYGEIRGKYAEVHSADPTIVLFMIGRDMWSLCPRHLEPAAAHNPFTDDGAKERREAGVHVTNGYLKKPDPYETHRFALGAKPDYYEWSRDQNSKHASMLAQAKTQLDRPVRTGALKNRDRYGQKLSLRGWSTDESEP